MTTHPETRPVRAPDASNPDPQPLTPDTPHEAAGAPRVGQEAASLSRPPTAIRCGSCPGEWTARAAAHCSGCHRTFSGIGLFDRHRSNTGERGRCTDPATIPGLRLVDGIWRSPEMTADQIARRRAS